jgi:hypothetical protein
VSSHPTVTVVDRVDRLYSTMLGSIIERDSSSSSSRNTNPSTFIPPPPSQNGFPKALHRSAFKKSLVASSRAPARADQPLRAPPVAPTLAQTAPSPQEGTISGGSGTQREVDEVLRSVQAENEARVAGMTAEERQSERDDLEARFGKGLLDGLRKRREIREGKQRESLELRL